MICTIIGHKIYTDRERGNNQACSRCQRMLDWRTGYWLRMEDHPWTKWRLAQRGNG